MYLAGFKVTKKDIKKYLGPLKNYKAPFGLKLWRVGAYIKDGEVFYFMAFHGQGLDDNVYNDKYDSIVEFKELYINSNYTSIEKINMIQEIVYEMVKEYVIKEYSVK